MLTTPADHGKERHFAVELLGLIARVFATAFALNIVMAGIILLFVSSQASATETGARAMRPADTGQGALLLRGEGAQFAAPTLNTDVAIRVSGPLARADVVQTFHNPGDKWMEGIYVFPLPENAAVDRLRIRIGDRVVEGEIQERAKAQATYERARAAGQRAALVEQERPNMFTTSVANIGPGEDVVVEISYRQELAYEMVDGTGRFSLRFPMVVGPRYIPGGGQVADAARITPPVLHPDNGPINPVSLRVELDAGVPIAGVSSSYHPVTVTREGENRRLVELASGTTPANRDFELVWTLATGNAPSATLFVEPAADRHHALLMVVPPTQGVETLSLPREVVFVIDTSGSMHGASITQARDALALAVRRLSPEDRFNVIEFNSRASAVFDSPRLATRDNVGRATAWVERLNANGGTEMAPALAMALDGGHDPERVRQVIFLTDGAVGNEEALFRLIEERLGDSRLFTVGIGSAPNSHFMLRAARAGRGTFTYIGKIDEVGKKMSELFAKLESPVLKSVSVRWPDGARADAMPDSIPDLYLGEPLLVAAELRDLNGGEIVVSGTTGEIRWESRLRIADANQGYGVGALWARRKIDVLLDSLRSGRPEDEVRPLVVDLALYHHLVSRYTSLVAVDRTPARPADANLSTAAMPTNLPEGWSVEAVFGELPRGATDARWHLLLGTLTLLFGAALLPLQRIRPLTP